MSVPMCTTLAMLQEEEKMQDHLFCKRWVCWYDKNEYNAIPCSNVQSKCSIRRSGASVWSRSEVEWKLMRDYWEREPEVAASAATTWCSC